MNNGFSYWLKHSLSHLKLHVMSNIYSEKDVIEQIETRSFLLKNLWSLQVRSYELRLFWNLIWSKFCFYGHWKSVLWLFSFCLKLIVISFSKFYLESNVCQNSCLNLRKNVNEICEKLQVCCQKALFYNFNRLVQISLYLKYDLFAQNISRVVFSLS